MGVPRPRRGAGLVPGLACGKMAELEGFLCPLCKQDCRSVRELETHYREAHDESSSSKLKKDFKSFFENAFHFSGSPKQPRAELSRSTSEERPVLEPVTNVSGIDTEYWPPQEMGKCCVLGHRLLY